MIQFNAVYESQTPHALLTLGGISAALILLGILLVALGKREWQWSVGAILAFLGILGAIVVTPGVTGNLNEEYHRLNLAEGLKSHKGWELVDNTETRWAAITREGEYIAGIWEEKSGNRYEMLPVESLLVIR